MKPQGWAAGGAAVATALLTGAAFWLSYEHLHDVAGGNGLSGSRAWAWPATVDLFIMIGELLMLRASLIGRGVDWWAVSLTVTGSGASIALNVAGVGSHAPTLTYVVAAVPPVAALLAFGALMRQVHDHLAVEAEPADFLDVIQEVPAEPTPEPVVIERVTERAEIPADLPEFPTFGPLVPVAELLARPAPAQDPEPGELLTVADVAAAKGVAEGTVRSWVSRNKLAPVQRDNGRPLFDPDDVAALN